MDDRPRLTLYSRRYCHLCADMRAALEPLCREYGVAIDEVDVDCDPELERRYNELVPLLVHRGAELARWRLDPAALRVYLSKIS